MRYNLNKIDSEQMVHERIVDYLRLRHKGVVFRTDFAAGIKLPVWLAARQRKLQYSKGFPDLFVFRPIGKSSGLAMEIKKAGTRLKKLDGSWASEHIQNQFNALTELEAAGYTPAFAVGYDQAVDILEWYLRGAGDLEFEDFILQNYTAPSLGLNYEEF